MGSELRLARERLGLSRRDISGRTKISPAILAAIEDDDLDRLPPPIFTRGFLRAYATEVGLDPQAILASYAPPAPPPPVEPDDPFERDEALEGTSLRQSSAAAGAIVAVAGALLLLLNGWPNPPREPAAVTAPPPAAAGAEAAVAVATTGADTPPQAAGSLSLRLEIAPLGPCWVEATADGTRLIYRLLQAGDRFAIEGYDAVTLRVGDPAAFAFTLNGSKGRPLGPPGRPTTVEITRGTAGEFVEPI